MSAQANNCQPHGIRWPKKMKSVLDVEVMFEGILGLFVGYFIGKNQYFQMGMIKLFPPPLWKNQPN